MSKPPRDTQYEWSKVNWDLSDVQIAAQLGCTPGAVVYRRKRHSGWFPDAATPCVDCGNPRWATSGQRCHDCYKGRAHVRRLKQCHQTYDSLPEENKEKVWHMFNYGASIAEVAVWLSLSWEEAAECYRMDRCSECECEGFCMARVGDTYRRVEAKDAPECWLHSVYKPGYWRDVAHWAASCGEGAQWQKVDTEATTT